MARTKPAGWYAFGRDGRRFWDGEVWTDHYAPAETDTLTWFLVIVVGVAMGVFAGLMLMRLAADANPDTFFVPIKVVVHQLPSSSPSTPLP